MKKLEALLITTVSWALGIRTGDCTAAAFLTVLFVPVIFENKRSVKNG